MSQQENEFHLLFTITKQIKITENFTWPINEQKLTASFSKTRVQSLANLRSKDCGKKILENYYQVTILSANNQLGFKIVLKILQLPSKHRVFCSDKLYWPMEQPLVVPTLLCRQLTNQIDYNAKFTELVYNKERFFKVYLKQEVLL